MVNMRSLQVEGSAYRYYLLALEDRFCYPALDAATAVLRCSRSDLSKSHPFMLAIRLTRTGKAHNPHYRLVVQEKRSKLTGKAIAYVGHYHPATKGKELIIDADAVRKYMAAGAQPSDTVANLLVREGILPESSRVKRPVKVVAVEETPAPAETPAEVVAEAPEEEVATEEAPEATTSEETPTEETTENA
jgi:small subunit ribosomal protein S16